MVDLFEEEMNDRAEIERLSGLVKELLVSGNRLAGELQSLVEIAVEDNNDKSALSESQEYIGEWNAYVKSIEGDWRTQILCSKDGVGSIDLGE